MVTGTGIFRDSLTFFRRNFVAMLLCMALPAVAGFVLMQAVNQVRTQHILSQLQSGATRTEVLHAPVLALLSIVSALISAVISSWLVARIYRLRLRAEFPVVSSESGATLRVFLWSFAVALSFVAFYGLFMLAVAPLSKMGAPVEFASLHFALGEIAGGILKFALLIYAVSLMLRFSLMLPGVAIRRNSRLSLAVWSKTRGVSWVLMGWLLLIVLGFAIFSYVISALLGLAGGAGVAEGRQFATAEEMARAKAAAMLAGQLVSGAAELLLTALAAAIFAEGYAQLNRPRA
jgi:hypothetical protein